MAKDITLLGAQYEDVPAVDLPKTGGGTARFYSAVEVVTKTSSDTTQTLDSDTFFIWPEMATLTITCPAHGEYAFRFQSGSTPTALTINGATMPDGFAVEANKVYEVNVFEGYGVAQSWSST